MFSPIIDVSSKSVCNNTLQHLLHDVKHSIFLSPPTKEESCGVMKPHGRVLPSTIRCFSVVKVGYDNHSSRLSSYRSHVISSSVLAVSVHTGRMMWSSKKNRILSTVVRSRSKTRNSSKIGTQIHDSK